LLFIAANAARKPLFGQSSVANAEMYFYPILRQTIDMTGVQTAATVK